MYKRNHHLKSVDPFGSLRRFSYFSAFSQGRFPFFNSHVSISQFPIFQFPCSNFQFQFSYFHVPIYNFNFPCSNFQFHSSNFQSPFLRFFPQKENQFLTLFSMGLLTQDHKIMLQARNLRIFVLYIDFSPVPRRTIRSDDSRDQFRILNEF